MIPDVAGHLYLISIFELRWILAGENQNTKSEIALNIGLISRFLKGG